jgi:hypothetical protein
LAQWESVRPPLYSIVTGFFPETSPKQTWATNPRPLLVCGAATDEQEGMHFCRIAYGTTQNLDRANDDDLVVGNVTLMNDLGLKRPTKFVIHSGTQMVIMPWTHEFFRPWSGYPTPVLSTLPQNIRRYVGQTLIRLSDLPQF